MKRSAPGGITLAWLALLLLCRALPPAAAQSSRADVKIFIPRPQSRPGIRQQEDFFAEQFKMEITAANYTVTDNRDEADYLMLLTIDANEYWGEPEEKQFFLTVAAVRTGDNVELVRFSWPFTEMTEMYQWNQYLMYQALALIPMVKEIDPAAIIEREVAAARDDRWRNKWLYLNFSAGADMTYLVRAGSVQTDQGLVSPAAFLGLELHFLNWMSLELDPARIRLLHDTRRYSIVISPSALLKWVFKPSDFAMIEPYAGAEYAIALSGEMVPWLSAQAGVQAGMRGGEHGAVIVDFGISYSLLGAWHLNGQDRDYGAMRFTFSVGYKLGFFGRR